MPLGTPTPPPPAPVAAFTASVHARLAREADQFFDEGDFPASVEVLRYRAAMDPGDYESITDLGWMLSNLGRESETESLYRTYAATAVNEVDRLLPMAEFLSRKRRFADQIVWLGPKIGDRKVHPNQWRLLARAYEMEDQFSDAIRVWKDYLSDHKDLAAEANLRRVEQKRQKTSR